MLRVLKLMSGNLANGPSTVRFPGQVAAPAEFRGLVRIESSQCLACGICAYVCVSRAITGREQESHYQWSYDPGRCTFCARCADRCPGRALALTPDPAPAYAARGELAVEVPVPLPVCPECGRPSRNTTETLLRSAFEHIDEKTRQLAELCPRCRRRRLQQGMKTFAGGQP